METQKTKLKEPQCAAVFSKGCRVVVMIVKGKKVLSIHECNAEDIAKAKKLSNAAIEHVNHKGRKLFSYIAVPLEQITVTFYK